MTCSAFVLAIHQCTDTLCTFIELKLKNILEIQQCCEIFPYASFSIPRLICLGFPSHSTLFTNMVTSSLPVKSCTF